VAHVALRHAQLLSGRFRVTLLSESFPDADVPQVDCHRLHPPCFNVLRRFAHVPNELALSLAARQALKALAMRDSLGMVICHGHPLATLAARPLRAAFGIPYALVTHGDIFDRPKGTYDARLTWFYRRTTPRAYRDAALVVALSPYIAELAIRGGADQQAVALIPNGIDPAEIGLDADCNATESPGDEGRLELLYVGRVSIEKGVDVLIDAAVRLHASGEFFRLRIVGAGPQLSRLQGRSMALGLSECVEFCGPMSRQRLGELYRSAHLVCVPSRSDTLPTVVLEAMASARPVLGSHVGGIPFMVRDGETGWLVPAGDAAALADRMIALSRDRPRMAQAGQAARRDAAVRFSWSATGEKLVAAILQVMDRTQSGHALGEPQVMKCGCPPRKRSNCGSNH
jgi:glycosyltransferase involved in cell wall biosynthesis